jgi:hypothetical protein
MYDEAARSLASRERASSRVSGTNSLIDSRPLVASRGRRPSPT